MEAEVVLLGFIQADGQRKVRPAIVLREMLPFNDLLLCGVSSQLRHYVVSLDEKLTPVDKDFKASGLNRESLIRLGWLMVVPKTEIIGTIGSIAIERHQRLLQKLSAYLLLSVDSQ